MNDFTLVELQIIHLDMTAYIHRTTMLTESPSHKALRDKVESMIDNYCEPSQCQHREIVIGAYPRSNPPKKCDLCGALYYE